MRIFTYKRVHINDPDMQGRFGINDCMGKIRSYKYDAVIGIGGIGAEPRSYGIDRKINWVGIDPIKTVNNTKGNVIVTFKHFLLLEEQGPLLKDMAPRLAKRFYEGGVRMLIKNYSAEELSEAIKILKWSKQYPQPNSVDNASAKVQLNCKNKYKPLQECKVKE